MHACDLKLILALGLSILMAALSAQAQTVNKQNPALASEQNEIATFVQQYCMRCHGREKQEGDLAFHQLGAKPVNRTQVEIWKKIFDKLESGEMPPEDAKQPSLDARKQAMLRIEEMLSIAGVTVDNQGALSVSG